MKEKKESCLFLYNPLSGKGKINKYIDLISEELNNKFLTVDIKQSTRPKEMQELATSACGVYDYLLFAGGDGTFNEIVNGISNCESRPILGYIPTGTVNDIAHSMGIPRYSIKKSLKFFLKNHYKEFDVIKINDKFAEYVVCAGALTGCSYEAPQSKKAKLGKFAYAFHMVKHNMKFEDFEIEVTINGEEKIKTNCEFVLFLNSRSVGSMIVNSKEVLNDGEIEMIIVKQVYKPKWYHKVQAFFNIIHFFALGYKLSKNKAVYQKIKGSSFDIKAPRNLVWNYDGEEGEKGNIHIDVLQKHIKIISKISR